MARPQKNEKIYIYGRHALEEALVTRPDVIKKVYLARDMRDRELRDTLAKGGIMVDELAPGRGKELAGRDAVHQGVVAVMDPGKLLVNFSDFIKSLEIKNSTGVAILGEVQDPHNVGAIIRSAAAFGLSGVLIPEHNQAQITGTVVKSSAGMAFRIPLVSIGNVNHTIKILKDRGFWIYALSMDGANKLSDEKFDAPAAFVIGNEGRGVREKTLGSADVTLSIPIHKRTESLNAAVSAGIVFYAWSAKHPDAI